MPVEMDVKHSGSFTSGIFTMDNRSTYCSTDLTSKYKLSFPLKTQGLSTNNLPWSLQLTDTSLKMPSHELTKTRTATQNLKLRDKSKEESVKIESFGETGMKSMTLSLRSDLLSLKSKSLFSSGSNLKPSLLMGPSLMGPALGVSTSASMPLSGNLPTSSCLLTSVVSSSLPKQEIKKTTAKPKAKIHSLPQTMTLNTKPKCYSGSRSVGFEKKGKVKSLATKKKKKGMKTEETTPEQSLEEKRRNYWDFFEVPDYSFTTIEDDEGLVIPKFFPADWDNSVFMMYSEVFSLAHIKREFINVISGSLLRSPNFKDPKDAARMDFLEIASRVANHDAEFVLKVALYTRCELNIRSTANFLLAFCSYHPPCRPYLRRYFSASIRLPSDWIDVAEQYQVFFDKSISYGALPAALRRAMVAKFPDFDKYQLAKYNKESSGKKKKKKGKSKSETSGEKSVRGRGRGRGRGGGFSTRSRSKSSSNSSSSSESSEESDAEEKEKAVETQISRQSDFSETEEELIKKSFTLKQLIRKLHITEPVEHVMCLVGKKYPESPEEFYKSRLPGVWEQERAGKRMKLPTPETWETQVSMKGNKASTWEDLIDHNKLPFMAMLRNLRNMIKAGVSEKHHAWVLRKLSDERAVTNSKQFPFRFFSAYEVLSQLEEEFEKSQNAIVDAAVASEKSSVRGRGRGRGRGGRGGSRGRGARASAKLLKETLYDPKLLARYKKALDSAVKIATSHNVSPIKGTTLIFCNLSSYMNAPCTAAKGLGKPRTVCEVGVLLGLMCKYSCEECQMIAFGNKTSQAVELEKGTILDNMQSVLQLRTVINGDETSYPALPTDQLKELLIDRQQIDNLIILSDRYGFDASEKFLTGFLKKYRMLVNPNLLFVNVDLSAASCNLASTQKSMHKNDIFIAGYSDQILRFIAERGDSGQLTHVEKIDQKYQLKASPPISAFDKNQERNRVSNIVSQERVLQLPSYGIRWRTARVFISSPFRDMHGERDLLTRFVFPELRARAQKHFINVYEVDLRWGIPEEDAQSNKAVEVCLSEVSKCQFFLCMLGERYGFIPPDGAIPDSPEFDWVREYCSGASVTELEIQLGALSKVQEMDQRAFFYFRDNKFESDIPDVWRSDFAAENSSCSTKMEKLKNEIRKSGLEVFDGYPAKWGGVIEKPMVTDLDEFGMRVLNNLWMAIQKYYPDNDAFMDEEAHITAQHDVFMENLSNSFVGRKNLIKKCMNSLKEKTSGIVLLHGKPGMGKSAIMASLVHEYVSSQICDSGLNVVTHFVGAAPGSSNITATLRRLCHEIQCHTNIKTELPEDYKNLCIKFSELLKEAGQHLLSPLVLFMDGLDLLDDLHQAHNLDWVPEVIPENVLFCVSACDDTAVYRALLRRKPDQVLIGGLDLLDKSEVVRSILATHRKQLDENPFNNQLKMLVSKKEAASPLFLSLACEELRVFGLFEKMTEKLKVLSHTVPALLQEIIARLESEHVLRWADMVRNALSLLVCTREGLSETELWELVSYADIVSCDKKMSLQEMIQYDIGKESIPQAVVKQLLLGMRCFLKPTGVTTAGHVSLAFKEVEKAVKTRYFKSELQDEESRMHRILAAYFLKCADPQGDKSWKGKNFLAFSELPHHLACAGCYTELEEILCDLTFIATKCLMGMGKQLLEDFQGKGINRKAADRAKAKFISGRQVEEYQSFVSRNLHIITRCPGLLWQQAVNEPSDMQPHKDAEAVIKSGMLGAGLFKWVNKPASSNPCVMTMPDLSNIVTCVAISPDGLRFACGDDDCVVKLYEVSTGKELKTFTGHANSVTKVCFVGNNRLCSASQDCTLSIWDCGDGHRTTILKGHGRCVSSCIASRDGNMVVSTSWDCQARVWEVSSGKQQYTVYEQRPLNCVAIHPDGQLIVTGSWDSTLKLWDIFNKSRKAVLRGHSTSVRDVAFSPSGHHIASASLDGDVKLWSSSNGSQVGNIRGHCSPINSLTFSPSGCELITASDDHRIKVWSGHLGKPLSCMGQADHGPVMSISIHPDGERLVAGYHEGHVSMFHIISGEIEWKVTPHTASVRKVCISPDGKLVVTASDDAQAKVLHTESGELMVSLKGHSKPVLSAIIGEMYIVTTSSDFTACVYSIMLLKDDTQPLCVLSGHDGPVTCCSFNGDETRLATGSRDCSVRIWELGKAGSGDLKPIHALHNCHSDWITSCVWSNTDDFLLTASNDFTMKLWDLKTKKVKVHMTGHMAAINQVAYKYGCMVSCCFDGSVKVWTQKGTEITTLYGHNQRVNGCDIWVKVKSVEEKKTSSDWATMATEEEWTEAHNQSKLDKKQVKVKDILAASCSDDGTIRVWHPLQGNELETLTGHSDRVNAVACSKSGTIISSSLDKSVRVWKPDLKKQVKVIEGHDTEVTVTEFSPSHKYLFTASRSGCVKLWSLDNTLEEETNFSFVCKYTFQAHEKAITSVCFNDKLENEFVTGSLDSTLKKWKITENKDRFFVKQVGEVNVESPITGVTYNRHYSKIHKNQAYTITTWDAGLSVYQAKGSKLLGSTKPHDDWILGCCSGPDNLLLTMGYDQQFSVHQGDQPVENFNTIKLEFINSHNRELWVTAAACDNHGFYVGNTHGRLSYFNHKSQEFTFYEVQVHSDTINGCAVGKDVFFTASQDKTIKVWRTQKEKPIQIGQFHCPVPITTIAALTIGGKDTVACGDQLGNVYLLLWKASSV